MAADFSGVAFPLGADGKVSTTAVGKAVFSAACAQTDEELSAAIRRERDWRHQYPALLSRLMDVCVASPENSMKIVRDGLSAVYNTFEFVRDGNRTSIHAALDNLTPEPVFTYTIKGSGLPSSWKLPCKEGVMEGQAAVCRVDEWVAYGAAEQDVASAVRNVATAAPDVLRSCLDRHVFVLLGGSSEMGPYKTLMSMGATVIVVCRNGSKLTKLIEEAKTSAGTLIIPISKSADEVEEDEVASVAGIDIAMVPELVAWLAPQFPDRVMVIGQYIYVDGEAHVRAVVSMDAIGEAVARRRTAGKTALAYLGSPATAFPIPMEAYQDSAARYAAAPWFHFIPFLTAYKENNRPLVHCVDKDGNTYRTAVTDGFSVFQGINYALAKTIQMWRAMHAHMNGMLVSVHMAPPTRTESVVHSATAASAIEGLAWFPPMRAFDAPEVSATMAALLINDFYSLNAPANPVVSLRSPADLFALGAFHGGGPRCAYQTESVSTTCYIVGRLGFTA